MFLPYHEILIRLSLAILVGGLIGYEREHKNMPAGFRTHIMVCVGAAIISMIEMSSVNQSISMIKETPSLANVLKVDMGRLGAQVITGIGFLGAGTIMHEKGSVRGLTTAASIWVVACIGLGVGMGYYFLVISATVGVYLVLFLLKKVEDKISNKS